MYNIYDTKLVAIQKEMWIKLYPQNDIGEYKKMVENIQEGAYHTLRATFLNYAKGALGGFGLSGVVTYLVNKIDS